MSKDELEVTDERGHKWMLSTKWLRITENPVAPKYPKVGETITLPSNYSFFLAADTPYIVSQVEEFEPANNPDEDGRDIRLSFVGCQHRSLNGRAIRKVMDGKL